MVAADSGFYGVLDGKGHFISNIVIHAALANVYNIAPIGINHGTVKNLHIKDSYVQGAWYTAGLVGKNRGTIDSCSFSGTLEGVWHTGGVVAINYGTLSHCAAQVAIEYASTNAGGLVGSNLATIRQCRASGTLVGGQTLLGGLVGSNEGSIDSSFADMEISIWDESTSNANKIGGFVGSHQGNINYCESRGKVLGHDDVGGFVGIMYGGSIKNSGARGAVRQILNAASYASLAGFVGNHQNGIIQNSYARGEVFAQSGSENVYVGGFVGNGYGFIHNSLATGHVHASASTGYAGGFAASMDNASRQSFSAGNVAFSKSVDAKTGGFAGKADSLYYNVSLARQLTGGDSIGLLAGISGKDVVHAYALDIEQPSGALGFSGTLKDSSTFATKGFWKDSLAFSFGSTDESPWVYNGGLHPWLYFMAEAKAVNPTNVNATLPQPANAPALPFAWWQDQRTLSVENRSTLPLHVDIVDIAGKRLEQHSIASLGFLSFAKPTSGLCILRLRSGSIVKEELLGQ